MPKRFSVHLFRVALTALLFPALLAGCQSTESKVNAYLEEIKTDPGHGPEIIADIVALGPEAAPALIKALGNPQTRPNALLALTRMGAPAVPSLLSVIATSADAQTRKGAINVLLKIGPDASSAAPQLLGLLDDPDPAIRAAAARALGTVGADPAKAGPKLEELAKKSTTEAEVRRAAYASLVSLKPAQEQWVLAGAQGLNDPDNETAMLVANTLGELGEDARPALTHLTWILTNHDHWPRREASAKALATIAIPDEKVVAALAKGLGDKETQVVRASAWALSELGPAAKAALPAFRSARVHPMYARELQDYRAQIEAQ
jgi:HEAT repeat protein